MRLPSAVKRFEHNLRTKNKIYGMIFCVVNEGAPQNTVLPECDVAVFGFGGIGEVDFEKELTGESDRFEEVAHLSKRSNCALVCACRTVSRGLLRKSVAVADRGKLLGISDMNHVLDGENYKSGVGLGFYKANGCKIGLCVENDLLFPDTFKALSLCGCNAVAVILEELKDGVPPLLIRAYAYLFGVPVVMCAGKTAYFADVSGAIASSAQNISLFEISAENRYHIVTTRTRGICSDIKQDY